MSSLAGKVALVTGASKGIGATIAKDFAAAGASVAVNYASSKAAADQVVAVIVAAGGKAVALQGDVSKPEAIDRVIGETVAAFGRLDILVNNAGVFEFKPLEAITPEHFSHAPEPYGSVYSASKAAVDAITRSLAKELGPRGIRVNSINPGMVETEGSRSLALGNSEVQAFQAQVAASTPLGRIAQPQDIGPVVVFLASKDSGWVTGKSLLVDGGHF